MPLFKHLSSLEIAQNLRAFLRLEVGLVRGEVPDLEQNLEAQALKLRQAEYQVHQLRKQLANRDRRSIGLNEGQNESVVNAIAPENIIWIFGTARVGSTWLAHMMEELENYRVWREPWVGLLFGEFYYERARNWQYDNKHFILGLHKETWLRSIRYFVLDGAEATFPKMDSDDLLVIKEPNGSIGAPLMMEALPESRMILLIRDPRDVIASTLDAEKSTSWAGKLTEGNSMADTQPDVVVSKRSTKYLRYISAAKQAYESHKGRKVMVKYEDLLSDTLNTTKHLCLTLGIPFDEDELAQAVEKHSWENVPEDQKGEGKFHRKAAPGTWKEDLTPKQVEMVEQITAPLLKEFYGG